MDFEDRAEEVETVRAVRLPGEHHGEVIARQPVLSVLLCFVGRLFSDY